MVTVCVCMTPPCLMCCEDWAFWRQLNVQFLTGSLSSAGVGAVRAAPALRHAACRQHQGGKEPCFSPCALLAFAVFPALSRCCPWAKCHPDLEPADFGVKSLQTVS